MIRDRELPAKVKAVNRANEEAKKLYEKLSPIFRPFVGHKIEKVDGSLLSKIEKLIPNLPYDIGIHFYRHNSNYSLTWMVKTCESIDGTTCLYHETPVTIGEMRDGVLTKICEWNANYPTYDVDTVRALRKSAESAKKIYEACKDACYPFGE